MGKKRGRRLALGAILEIVGGFGGEARVRAAPNSCLQTYGREINCPSGVFKFSVSGLLGIEAYSVSLNLHSGSHRLSRCVMNAHKCQLE